MVCNTPVGSLRITTGSRAPDPEMVKDSDVIVGGLSALGYAMLPHKNPLSTNPTRGVMTPEQQTAVDRSRRGLQGVRTFRRTSSIANTSPSGHPPNAMCANVPLSRPVVFRSSGS